MVYSKINLKNNYRKFKNKLIPIRHFLQVLGFLYVVVAVSVFTWQLSNTVGQIRVKLVEAVSAPLVADNQKTLSPLADTEVKSLPTVDISGAEEIKLEIDRVFGLQGENAKRVAYCESRFNPNAKNPITADYGVFQINTRYHPIDPKFLYDSKINIGIAKYIYDKEGWQPWSSTRRCHGL